MGIAIAEKAADYGASVDLVLGPVAIMPQNSAINVVKVVTARSMATECLRRFPSCDIAILSAAVADFTPAKVAVKKIKKDDSDMVLQLTATTDIAHELGKIKKKSQLLAGFALETDNELENAKSKLKRKNLDLIVLNSLQEEGAGFDHDTNRITIIDRDNNINKFELKSKAEAAKDILDKIVALVR